MTCVFSALSYAELASAIPVSGSAYTYSYATIGELVAWIIGWDLILEYGVSIAAVAVGWGGYLNELLDSPFGLRCPTRSPTRPARRAARSTCRRSSSSLAVTARADRSACASRARTNTVMVVLQARRAGAVPRARRHRVRRRQLLAVLRRRATDRRHRDGGDADLLRLHRLRRRVHVRARRSKKPERDLPMAIIGSLVIATTLYILVALVATGALPVRRARRPGRAARRALSEGAGINWAATVISFGALIAITSVVLTLLYGQTRILFAMWRDGLVPRVARRVHPTTRTPIYIGGRGVLDRAARRGRAARGDREAGQHRHAVRVPAREHRRDHPAPDRARTCERGFRVPFVRSSRSIGTLLCIYLMADLPGTTWVRFVDLDGASACSSTSPTAAATRACARARSSTRRPSSPGPANVAGPGRCALRGGHDERVALAGVRRDPHLEPAVRLARRVVRHRAPSSSTDATRRAARQRVPDAAASPTGASLVSVVVV